MQKKGCIWSFGEKKLLFLWLTANWLMSGADFIFFALGLDTFSTGSEIPELLLKRQGKKCREKNSQLVRFHLHGWGFFLRCIILNRIELKFKILLKENYYLAHSLPSRCLLTARGNLRHEGSDFEMWKFANKRPQYIIFLLKTFIKVAFWSFKELKPLHWWHGN